MKLWDMNKSSFEFPPFLTSLLDSFKIELFLGTKIEIFLQQNISAHLSHSFLSLLPPCVVKRTIFWWLFVNFLDVVLNFLKWSFEFFEFWNIGDFGPFFKFVLIQPALGLKYLASILFEKRIIQDLILLKTILVKYFLFGFKLLGQYTTM